MNSSRSLSSVFRSLISLLFVLLTVNVNLTACVSQRLETVTLAVERAGSDDVLIRVEIARTDEERNKGLMYRKSIPDGEGMLFVFERDQQLSFWMKNTLIPLSIAYIASDGRITEIRDMYPHDENSVHSSRSVRYALEVPQGWFGRVGIRPGDVVRIDTL
jgi:uncharacterized membrane protein (UPF0127 family)